MMETRIFSSLLADTEKDADILAVVVFGSYAREEEFRDIDVCLFLYPEKSKMLKTKIKQYMKYLGEFDLHLFHDLSSISIID